MKEPKYTKSRKKLQFIPAPVLDSMEWFLKANHVRVSSVERYFGMPSNALGHRHEKPSVTEAELARMTDIFDGDDTENAQEKIVRLDAQAKDLRGHHIRGNLTEIPENILTAMDKLAEELKCASHRDSDTGFLLGAPEEPGGAEGFHQEREYCARVTGYDAETGEARLLLKNRVFVGEELELMTPKGVRKVTAKPFLREKTGEIMETLGIAGETIRMELPGCEAGDILRGPVRNHRR